MLVSGHTSALKLVYLFSDQFIIFYTAGMHVTIDTTIIAIYGNDAEILFDKNGLDEISNVLQIHLDSIDN